MARKNTRVRVDEEGYLEVVDPGFDSLELLRSIDPTFRVRRSRLSGFTSPRFFRAREAACEITLQQLVAMPERTLWEIHKSALKRLRDRARCLNKQQGEASLLDVKIELSRRLLSHC